MVGCVDGFVAVEDRVNGCADTVLDMAERWTISGTRTGEGAVRLPIGPGPDTLPSAFTAELDHSAEPFVLGLSCKYRGIGSRVEVDQVTVTARQGRTIAPRDLSSIELARAVYLVAQDVVEPRSAVQMDRRPGRRPTPDELRLVAEVYSWHYVAWGAPARAVMAIWEIPRSTANRWLRTAREMFPSMPGDTATADGLD
jgi:hypothetical protein